MENELVVDVEHEACVGCVRPRVKLSKAKAWAPGLWLWGWLLVFLDLTWSGEWLEQGAAGD